MNKVVFWDFQGTLAHNDWMISKALYKVLLQNEPETKITNEFDVEYVRDVVKNNNLKTNNKKVMS